MANPDFNKLLRHVVFVDVQELVVLSPLGINVRLIKVYLVKF
jgi:hypothetical protein